MSLFVFDLFLMSLVNNVDLVQNDNQRRGNSGSVQEMFAYYNIFSVSYTYENRYRMNTKSGKVMEALKYSQIPVKIGRKLPKACLLPRDE